MIKFLARIGSAVYSVKFVGLGEKTKGNNEETVDKSSTDQPPAPYEPPILKWQKPRGPISQLKTYRHTKTRTEVSVVTVEHIANDIQQISSVLAVINSRLMRFDGEDFTKSVQELR